MVIRKLNLILFLLIFVQFFVLGQKVKDASQSKVNFRLMFYNTENLFDTGDDPFTDDNDFTPEGKYHWTYTRYKTKLLNIYKTIISVGTTAPAVVGLCEVENKKVLTDLLYLTPLKNFKYNIIHFDSKDQRGIDVAMLYRPDLFKVLLSYKIEVKFKGEPNKHTRDILYVKGIALNADTLNIYINHWPSRRGGELKSLPFRETTAKTLKSSVDSVFLKNKNSHVIIMGDFNDEPDDASIVNSLGVNSTCKPDASKRLYNMACRFVSNSSSLGTIKFRGKWLTFDQFIVSNSLLDPKSKGLKTNPGGMSIFNEAFLLKTIQEDEKTLFRTYAGFRYEGGFSDHLPILLDLYK